MESKKQRIEQSHTRGSRCTEKDFIRAIEKGDQSVIIKIALELSSEETLTDIITADDYLDNDV